MLKKIKRLKRYVREILMSAYEVENKKDFRGFMNEGVIDKFIQKPVTLNCLCEEVNDQVHAYQLKMNV